MAFIVTDEQTLKLFRKSDIPPIHKLSADTVIPPDQQYLRETVKNCVAEKRDGSDVIAVFKDRFGHVFCSYTVTERLGFIRNYIFVRYDSDENDNLENALRDFYTTTPSELREKRSPPKDRNCTREKAGDHSPRELRPAPSSPGFSQQVAGELPFLRRIVRRWRNARADADDLVQDTLLRALASAHLYQPGSNLRAWLFTIMRNHFLSNRARSKREGAALQAYADVTPAHALDNQQARLTLRDVQRTMERMPRVQRLALMLVGAEDNSHDDVARGLDISTGAVRCHLTRARARLRNDVLLVAPSSPFRRTVVANGRHR